MGFQLIFFLLGTMDVLET